MLFKNIIYMHIIPFNKVMDMFKNTGRIVNIQKNAQFDIYAITSNFFIKFQ